MPGDEPRRSGRANKGQHKHASDSPAPETKPAKPTKKDNKTAASQVSEDEEAAEVIRCVCGDENANDKRAFIGCDSCSVWQHNVCMGMPDDEDEVGEHYFCEQCKPEEHGETLEALERGDKIWETRNKLYNAEKKAKKGRKSKGGKDEKPSWLKRELRDDAPGEAPPPPEPETVETGTKRKRSVKEETEEAEQKPAEKSTRSARQDKRRKADVKPSPDPDTSIVPVDKLPADRQKIVQALTKLLADDFDARASSSDLKLTGDETPKSLADHHATRIEYALHMNHGGPGSSSYGTQFRALFANLKKNKTLTEELLAGRLTADELSTMSTTDMASDELQKERAAMKAEADRQMTIEQVDQGPRYRRTHKGDEIVENEAAATSSAPVSRPVRHSTADGEPSAASPSAASPGVSDAKNDDDRRASGATFDMKNIWAKTDQGTGAARPLQIPARRRSSMQPQQEDGTKFDADVDRLLADDDESYSPQEYPDDIVWRGKVVSTTGESAPVVNARWVAGRDVSQTISWRQLLPDKLNIDGRLQITKAEEYLCGLQWSSSSDVSVLALTPYDDAEAFNKVFEYFKSRERYAVVNKDKPAALLVKDLYIIPVDAGGKLPDHIEMLEHCTIKKPLDERLLLATFVVARSSEPLQQNFSAASAQPTNGHRSLSTQGPAASPINPSGPFPHHSPAQQAYTPQPAPPYSAAAASPAHAYNTHEAALKMAYDILGPLYHCPVAQDVLAAPGVTSDVVFNMKKIFDEDIAARTDMNAFAARLGLLGGGNATG